MPLNQPGDGDDEMDMTRLSPAENHKGRPSSKRLNGTNVNDRSYDGRSIAELALKGQEFDIKKQFDKAEACYREALTAVDQFELGEWLRCDVLVGLANVVGHQGKFGESIAMLEAAYELADSVPMSQLKCWVIARELQNILTQQGSSEVAARWKERADGLIRGKMEEQFGPRPKEEKNENS